MTQLMEKKKAQSESSASGPSGGLPLVSCPKCDVKMIWAVSGSSKNQGKEYYKCPNNDGKYSSGCDTFMWKDQYAIHLAGLYFKEREKTEGCRVKLSNAQGTDPMVCHVDDHLMAHLAEINKSLDQINQSILESAPAGSLTAEQLSFFDSNGYLVLELFSSAEEVQVMRGRMAELVDWFDDANSTVFSTKDHRQVKDDYFFKSTENISFFFEEKAFGDDGCLKQPKELSINKVGHGYRDGAFPRPTWVMVPQHFRRKTICTRLRKKSGSGGCCNA